jgi:hypothetical protein
VTVTPLSAVARGLVAGAVGTAAMDTFLFARYRRHGGESSAPEWESSTGVTSWDQAPAPAHVGKRLVEGLFDIQLAPNRARLVNNVMHCTSRSGTTTPRRWPTISARISFTGSLRPPRCGCYRPGTSKEAHV